MNVKRWIMGVAVALGALAGPAMTEPANAALSNCWAGVSGRNFAGHCSGSGRFYVAAQCVTWDGRRYVKYGNTRVAPGWSTGQCPSGWWARSAWIVRL